MRLAEHCRRVLELTKRNRVELPPEPTDASLIEIIREKIDQQVITTNVLRTYAAICYFLQYQDAGVTQEQLNQILTYEDQVTKKDVTYCLGRLEHEQIIKKRDGRFLMNVT